MAFYDSRPPALDVPFRPGNTFSANLTWTPSLTGRTFIASCGNQTPTVAINGQVMAITMTAAQTAALGFGSHLFALTETTGGISDDIIIGRWQGSDSPNDITSASVEVKLSSGAISVTVLGVAAAVSSLTVAGATNTNTLTVTGASTFRGVPLAQYERVTFQAKVMDGAFGAAPTYTVDALDYPGWDLADGVTRTTVWPFAPPRIGVDGSTHLFWNTFEVAAVWVNLGAAAGNVRWRCEIRNLAIGIDVVNEAPAHDQFTTMGAAGQNVCNAGLIATSVPVSPAFFGSEWAIKVSRIGADGADTLAATTRLAMVSFNRVT